MKLTIEQIKKILEGAPKDSTHVDSLGFYHNNDGSSLSDLREILELRREVERLHEGLLIIDNDLESRNFLESSSLRDKVKQLREQGNE